jgi:regulator of replication initiation timing
MTEDLSANEMVSYANAMSERIVELERENRLLREENQQLKEQLNDSHD